MSRYICIHGHFYQPPRENPWLEEVEVEDSAYPYHDWNARITAECYAPNAASRILDREKRIIDIGNNYEKISFNIGPTLLAWMEERAPEVYSAILEADRLSRERFSGHGSALAQVYNHLIMPLANPRDRQTQIIWGIRDFRHRFGREPEGMWLPETAVDNGTLDILAEEGIGFTLLSPKQARRVRKINGGAWTDVSMGTIDSSLPYLCRLPSGRSISIFFYDEQITQEVAFSSLLENGEVFANRLMRFFAQNHLDSGLLSVASDGETYGHHHRFGDMALAYALYLIGSKHPAHITVFGEYLAMFPPAWEVEIVENTSWSCIHGIERWRSDCGCCTHGTVVRPASAQPVGVLPAREEPGTGACDLRWHQKWRAPLRDAMDWLRDALIPHFTARMNALVRDPWQARDDYIEVILNRSPETVDAFLARHSHHTLSRDERMEALRLLEMQRNALLMYTSCGWFFDDISGIESVQVMRYACRAMQLLREVTGIDLEPEYQERLKKAPSNVPERGDGAKIYQDYVRTSVADLSRVGFHFALSTLVTDSPDDVRIRNFTIRSEAYEQSVDGELRLATGKLFLRSDITGEEKTLLFAVLYMGNHNFLGGAADYTDEAAFTRMRDELKEAFAKRDIPLLVLSLGRQFGAQTYTLWHLFRDGQRKVLYHLLDSTLAELEAEYRQIYRQHYTLIKVMRETQIPVPKALEDPVWYILNTDLKNALARPVIDTADLFVLVSEMTNGKFAPDTATLNFTASRAITSRMKRLHETDDNVREMETINALFRILLPLSLNYDLWECQNMYFRICREKRAYLNAKAGAGNDEARRWLAVFDELGRYLGVKCSG
jgi:alpha-amylase/alpha-mannosidase (GH57 family)